MNSHHRYTRLIRATVILPLMIHMLLTPVAVVPSPPRLLEPVRATSPEIPRWLSIPSYRDGVFL